MEKNQARKSLLFFLQFLPSKQQFWKVDSQECTDPRSKIFWYQIDETWIDKLFYIVPSEVAAKSAYDVRQSYYLRISATSVLRLILQMDPHHVSWMNVSKL